MYAYIYIFFPPRFFLFFFSGVEARFCVTVLKKVILRLSAIQYTQPVWWKEQLLGRVKHGEWKL